MFRRYYNFLDPEQLDGINCENKFNILNQKNLFKLFQLNSVAFN